MKQISINDIHLALWNPRFETIDKLEFDYIKYFNKWDKNYSLQEEALKISELIKENIDKYKELFDSVKAFFRSSYEKIQLIKSENSYIVIEGNRRISCLKILMNYDKYQKFIYELLKGEINVESTNEFISKLSILYMFIEQNKLEFNVPIKTFLNLDEYVLYSSNEHIANSLFSKHSATTPIGFVAWNKGKYYYDLWSIFNKENWYSLEDINENKSLELFSKNKRGIFEDYKKATFLFQLYNLSFSKQNELTLKDYFVSIPPTAFEPNNVNQTLRNIILYIDKSADVKKYVNLTFEPITRCYINKGIFNIKNILEFIDELRMNDLQTSKFDMKKVSDMVSIFYKHLNLDEKKYDTWTQKDFINNFMFMSENELSSIKRKYKNTNISSLIEERLYQFKVSESIIKDLKAKKADVLVELVLQIEHNTNYKDSKFFINAIHSSIRTILEYIMKLIVYKGITKYHKNSENYLEFMKIIAPESYNKYVIIDDEVQQRLIQSLLTNKILKTSDNKLSWEREVFRYILSMNKGRLSKLDELCKNEIFKKSFREFFNDNLNINDFNYFMTVNWDWINSMIHRVYLQDFEATINIYSKLISKNNEILLEFLTKILKNLNKSVINKLVKEINNSSDKNWTKLVIN